MGSSLAHQTSKKNCLISAYAGMPCTTCVKGRVRQLGACPDASGRLYDCGNTGQNTDLLEIEYPKNSLFNSDKWAPAPPRWLVYTWSSQIWHSLLQTRLALPSLHIFTWNPSPCKPCIFGLHQVHTRFTSLLLGAHAGPPRTRNDADNSLWHASDAKQHVSGWIHLVWILGKATSILKGVYLQT